MDRTTEKLAKEAIQRINDAKRKDKRNLKKGKSKKKSRSLPRLADLSQKVDRPKWQDKEPRLPEATKKEIQEVVAKVRSKHAKEVTRQNFADIHERMEEELSDIFYKQYGLWAGLEWRIVWSRNNYRRWQDRDFFAGHADRGVDGILPLKPFLQSNVFDLVERFEPRVVVFRHDDYTSFIDDAERSIKEANNRRKRGDAYFTDRDRVIGFRPGPLADEGNQSFGEEE